MQVSKEFLFEFSLVHFFAKSEPSPYFWEDETGGLFDNSVKITAEKIRAAPI